MSEAVEFLEDLRSFVDKHRGILRKISLAIIMDGDMINFGDAILKEIFQLDIFIEKGGLWKFEIEDDCEDGWALIRMNNDSLLFVFVTKHI